MFKTIKKVVAVFTFTVLLPSFAAACPAWELDGYSVTYTGSDLYAEKTVQIVAGGESIDRCKMVMSDGTQPSGYFADTPDVELRFSGPGDYYIRFSVDGDCDTKLLINTADGDWFYDDDSGDGLDPIIRVTNPPEGTYDIWVGTYESELCNSVLQMETFTN